MDTQLVKTALLVARLGSFTSAAQMRGVDPSSISRQVSALESELGLRLFERSTRRLQVSEAGEIYLDRMAQALDLIDEAGNAARDLVSRPGGLLRVTTSVALGERWLVPHLPGFRADYPEVDLELLLSDSVLDLSAERVDLALRLGPQPQGGSFILSKLFRTRYRVVAAPGYLDAFGSPGNPGEINDHDGLLFALPGFQSAWQFCHRDTGQEETAGPRPRLTISNALALRRAALDGLGVALLADWTVADDLRTGRLVDLFPEWDVRASAMESAVWLMYPADRYVPYRLRVLIDHLKAAALRFPDPKPS